MKKIIISHVSVLMFLCIHFNSDAQHRIGLKINGGLSRLSTPLHHTGEKSRQILFATSGQTGVFYCRQTGKRSVFGFELLFVPIRAKERRESTSPYTVPTGQYVTSDILRYINYIGIPVYYGFRFKKFTVNLGGQVNFMVNKGWKYKYYLTNGVVGESKGNNLEIKSYDYGARAGIIYKLSGRFAVEGTYYYGINSIVKATYYNWPWKIQQITVGMRYNIFTNSRSGSNNDL